MITSIKTTLKNIHPVRFSILLTLFFIITHFQKIISANHWLVLPLILTSSIGILFENYRESKYLWIIQGLLYFYWVILIWQQVDNHIYLWGYWMLAIGIGLSQKAAYRHIQISAKVLIAGSMLMAVIQKLNPTFLSGDFFYFQLLTDYRFCFIGQLIDVNMVDIVEKNKALLEQLLSNSDPILLHTGPSLLSTISNGLTWYIVVVELAIAIAFLLPKGYHWQHWFMLLFLSTYFILPIQGFAFTLLTLSFTLVKKHHIGLKLTYILFLFYILIFSPLVMNILIQRTLYSV
jgi:hypothetical protein